MREIAKIFVLTEVQEQCLNPVPATRSGPSRPTELGVFVHIKKKTRAKRHRTSRADLLPLPRARPHCVVSMRFKVNPVRTATMVSSFAAKLRAKALQRQRAAAVKELEEDERTAAERADNHAMTAAERAVWLEATTVFKSVDTDNNGALDFDELRLAGAKLGWDFDESELTSTFKLMDKDSDGDVDFDEFYEWWVDRKEKEGPEGSNMNLHNRAVAMFKRVDTDGSGALGMDNVDELAGLLGFRFTNLELLNAMEQMDDDKSGTVSFEEFYKWFQARHSCGDIELHNEAVELFGRVDADDNGLLDAEELSMLTTELGF